MTVNDLFSKDAARNINRTASAVFGEHLFIFCEYEPDTIIPISVDAQYLAGALNLYKMFIDSGISVPLVKANIRGLNREEKDKWETSIRRIGQLRTIYSHNIGDDQEAKREYINWLRCIIRKDSFETMEDYTKGLNAIIGIQSECCNLLRKFINQTGSMFHNEERKDFVQRWEELILHYYTKNDYKVFLGQVRIAMINKGTQANKTNKLKVAMWFQNYYEYELKNSIKASDDLIRKGKLPSKTIITIRENRDAKQRRINEIRGQIADFAGRDVSNLRTYDYQNYYCSELEMKLNDMLTQLKANEFEDKEERISNITMLPSSILQLLIKKDFKNIPIS